jgi:hypothetical protein
VASRWAPSPIRDNGDGGGDNLGLERATVIGFPDKLILPAVVVVTRCE